MAHLLFFFFNNSRMDNLLPVCLVKHGSPTIFFSEYWQGQPVAFLLKILNKSVGAYLTDCFFFPIIIAGTICCLFAKHYELVIRTTCCLIAKIMK